MLKNVILSLILIFFSVSRTSGQEDTVFCPSACHSPDDMTPSGIMCGDVHSKNQWMVSYRIMRMHMEGVVSGNERLTETEQFAHYQAASVYMDMDMHMFMLMYGVTPRFTLMGMAHYNSNYMKMRMNMGTVIHGHAMQTSGMGDTKLYAMYKCRSKQSEKIITTLGVSIPTGSTRISGKATHVMYPLARFPYAMQMGTGTWDIMPALTYLYQTALWNAGVQAHATIRSGFTKLGYRWGNEVQLNAWLARRMLPFLSTSLRTEAAYAECIKGSDRDLEITKEVAANPANYGGSRYLIYPGVLVQFEKSVLRSFRWSAEYGLPVFESRFGWQMPVKRSFNFSVSVAF